MEEEAVDIDESFENEEVEEDEVVEDDLAVADDDEVIRPGDSNYEFEFYESDGNSEDMLTQILTDANECGMNILYKYDIADEFREVA